MEKLPNNPYLGRRIATRFAEFISECSGDFSATKKNSTLLHNISKNLKAHSLLYILHQIFIHENRFAQLFDIDNQIGGSNDDVSPTFDKGDIVDEDSIKYEKQIQKIIMTKEKLHQNNRESNRCSMVIEELGGGKGDNSDEEEQNDQLFLNINETNRDRLDLLTMDSDYYTSLLLSIVEIKHDEGIPKEILASLEPVKEKCQLIIFQLITLLNRQTLSMFIHRKKQLRSLLQNIIELIMSGSLEFRAPFTLYGGEKKLRVF